MAPRTVSRLTESAAASSRSLGSWSPISRIPVAMNVAIFWTTKSFMDCFGTPLSAVPSSASIVRMSTLPASTGLVVR
jgi:hypothetical protein